MPKIPNNIKRNQIVFCYSDLEINTIVNQDGSKYVCVRDIAIGLGFNTNTSYFYKIVNGYDIRKELFRVKNTQGSCLGFKRSQMNAIEVNDLEMACSRYKKSEFGQCLYNELIPEIKRLEYEEGDHYSFAELTLYARRTIEKPQEKPVIEAKAGNKDTMSTNKDKKVDLVDKINKMIIELIEIKHELVK